MCFDIVVQFGWNPVRNTVEERQGQNVNMTSDFSKNIFVFQHVKDALGGRGASAASCCWRWIGRW